MKIYRYRDISTEEKLKFLFDTELKNRFWCSNLKKLNDRDEFKFKPDCTTDKDTEIILNMLRTKEGSTRAIGLLGTILDREGYLADIAKPRIEDMITKARRDLGLACFSLSKGSDYMWLEYGGEGNGVCIEIDVPDYTIDLHNVSYVKEKNIPINKILASAIGDRDATEFVFRNMLCTKTEKWRLEDEVRFVISLPVIERQNKKKHRRERGQKKRPDGVFMNIIGSVITEVVFGNKIAPETFCKIKTEIEKLPNGGSILLTHRE